MAQRKITQPVEDMANDLPDLGVRFSSQEQYKRSRMVIGSAQEWPGHRNAHTGQPFAGA